MHLLLAFCGSVTFPQDRSALIPFYAVRDIMRILFKLICWGQGASFPNITAELKASELSCSNKQHVVVVYWHAFNVNDWGRQTEGSRPYRPPLSASLFPGVFKNVSISPGELKGSIKAHKSVEASTLTLKKSKVCVENRKNGGENPK